MTTPHNKEIEEQVEELMKFSPHKLVDIYRKNITKALQEIDRIAREEERKRIKDAVYKMWLWVMPDRVRVVKLDDIKEALTLKD